MSKDRTQDDVVKESATEVANATSELRDAISQNDINRIREINRRVERSSRILSTALFRLAQYDRNIA